MASASADGGGSGPTDHNAGGGATAELPPDLELVRTTSVFTESSVPAGLLATHRVASGVWGRLVVSSGAVLFRFEDDQDGNVIGAPGSMVIPPNRPHHLEILGPVRFVVEFHRRRD
jgi:tellurite resistance-related uncharacterized protein